MALVRYGKANGSVGDPPFVIAWSGGSQDVRTMAEFTMLDDGQTAQMAAYDASPWLYRAGGATSIAAD